MGASIRIVTANLKNGGGDPDLFAALVESLEADVVACQELAPAQADALARVLPHGELRPRLDYRGLGIALRRSAKMGSVSLPYRDGGVAALSPEHWPELGRTLEIVNVHISAPTQHPVWIQPVRRFRQSQRLLDYVDAEPSRTRVIVGDFNSTPAWPVYWRLARRFEDLALTYASGRSERPGRTWSPRPLGLRMLRIDHCFGRGVWPERVQVHPIPGSDHCAVAVDLCLTPQR
jgi:endonuclease/exonuclease/phosphatase family metal-dependent hydrolase